MTNRKRIINILIGIVMIIFAVIIILDPKDGMLIVLGVTGSGFTLRGLGLLIYYFRMARHMVGGKTVLYRSIIFLDAGLLIASISYAPNSAVILYMAGANTFSGVVSLLRVREARKVSRTGWRWNAAFGLLCLIMAAAGLIGGLFMGHPELSVYFYAVTLFFSAATRFKTAFQRTAIIYIP